MEASEETEDLIEDSEEAAAVEEEVVDLEVVVMVVVTVVVAAVVEMEDMAEEAEGVDMTEVMAGVVIREATEVAAPVAADQQANLKSPFQKT